MTARDDLRSGIMTAIYSIPVTIGRGNAEACADSILALVDQLAEPQADPDAKLRELRGFVCSICIPIPPDAHFGVGLGHVAVHAASVIATKDCIITEINRLLAQPAPPAEKPSATGCADCGRLYGDEHGFPDMVIPDAAWEEIQPKPSGGGLLCPSCMCERAHEAGLSQVPATFTSGPFASPPARAESAGAKKWCERVRQWWNTIDASPKHYEALCRLADEAAAHWDAGGTTLEVITANRNHLLKHSNELRQRAESAEQKCGKQSQTLMANECEIHNLKDERDGQRRRAESAERDRDEWKSTAEMHAGERERLAQESHDRGKQRDEARCEHVEAMLECDKLRAELERVTLDLNKWEQRARHAGWKTLDNGLNHFDDSKDKAIMELARLLAEAAK